MSLISAPTTRLHNRDCAINMKYKHKTKKKKKTDKHFLINTLSSTRDKTPPKVCIPCNLQKIVLR